MKFKNSILACLPVVCKPLKEKEQKEAYLARKKLLSYIPKIGKIGYNNSKKGKDILKKDYKKILEKKEYNFLDLLSKQLQQQKFIRGTVLDGAIKKRSARIKNFNSIWKRIEKNFPPIPALIKYPNQLFNKTGVYPNTCFSKDPVNLATGNFIYSTQDISTNGRFAITFSRFYNAIDNFKGMVGQNWRCNFDICAKKVNSDDRKIILEDGQAIYFKYKNGNYLSTENDDCTLIKNKDETLTLYLTYATFFFHQDGKIIKKKDIFDNETHFEYKENRLIKVFNNFAQIFLKYNDKGYLSNIKDHTGRIIFYHYYCDNLISVTDINGNTYEYHYYKNGLLKEIVNPLGITFIKNFYDESGRTLKQSFPDSSNMFYQYDNINRITTLTERNKEKILYYRDEKYQVTKVDYFDGSEIFNYNKDNKLIKYIDKNSNIYNYEYTQNGQCNAEIDPLGNKTQYQFDLDGTLIEKKLANGSTEKYHYDSQGNLVEIVNPIGIKDSFEYDKIGNLITYTRDGLVLLKIGYDNRGNIINLTDGEGNETKYEYDSLNRMIKMILPEGGETKFAYTPSGKVLKIINAYGDSTEFVYDKAENIISKKDFADNVTKYEYNQLNRLIKEINPLGNKSEYFYNEMWDVTCETDKNGGNIFYEYDGLQRIIGKIDQEGNKTEYTYDPNGNIIRIKNPRGNQREYKYDSLNRIIQCKNEEGFEAHIFYDTMGNIVKTVDFEGNTICYEYDAFGQVISVKDEVLAQTKYVYNNLGLVEKVIDANGGICKLKYNHNGKLIQLINPMENFLEFKYNKNGKLIEFRDYSGQKTCYIYDKLNQLIQVIDPIGNSKKFEYNKIGEIIKMTDENGNETKYEYDAVGNLIQVTNANDISITYTYDPNSNLTSIDKYGIINKTCFEYDKRNFQTRRTDPDGKTVSYKYDEVGNLISKITRDGQETCAQYNASDLISKIIYPDNTSIEYIYNQMGKLTEIKDFAGSMKIELDQKGRPVHTKERDGKNIYFQYSQTGEITNIRYPDGYEVNYEYDKNGRMTKVIDGEKKETCYVYGFGEELKEIKYPNNWKIIYNYNSLNQIKEQQSLNASSIVIEDIKYSYDAVGNTIIQKKKEQSEFLNLKFPYIDKEKNNFEDTGITSYIFNHLNQLIEVKREKGISTRYEYDKSGNRIKMESRKKENHLKTITYQYNTMNQLLQEEIEDINKTEKKKTIKKYFYNENGNLKSIEENKNKIQNYYYNGAGQLAAIEKNTGDYSLFDYDGIGRRLKSVHYYKNENQYEETNYVLDYTKSFNNVIMTYDEDNTNNKFIKGINFISLLNSKTNQKFYYLNDNLGSPSRLIDEEGLTENAYRYDEYGISYEMDIKKNIYGYLQIYQKYHEGKYPQKDKIKNPFGFTGYQYEEDNGLYFAQARYYNSKLGRFIQQDSMGNTFIGRPLSFNLYIYCENNPIYFIDPLGLISHSYKNSLAQRYVQQGGSTNYNATESLVIEVMRSGNPRDDAHTLGEILLYDCLSRYRMRTELEVTIQAPGNTTGSYKSNYIDVLAVSSGNAFIFDIKSINEITRIGTGSARDQIKRYSDDLRCEGDQYDRKIRDFNNEVKRRLGIQNIIDPSSNRGFGRIQVIILRNRNYYVEMESMLIK